MYWSAYLITTTTSIYSAPGETKVEAPKAQMTNYPATYESQIIFDEF